MQGEFKIVRSRTDPQGAEQTAKNKFALANCVDPDVSKLKSGVTFSACDGSTKTGTMIIHDPCTQDGQIECLTSGDFITEKTSNVTAMDIRAGKSIAGIAGTFNLPHCRNGFNNTQFNNSGLPTLAASNSAGGSDQFDWWDTVDMLMGANGPTVSGTPWDSRYFCDGSQITNVSNSASHLTTGQSYNCGGQCTNSFALSAIYHEPYTRLYFTNPLTSGYGCGAASTCADWAESVAFCRALNTGDGTDKWRLPTLDEITLLYDAGVGKNPTGYADYNATGTTMASDVTQAFYFGPGRGNALPQLKTAFFATTCVREVQ